MGVSSPLAMSVALSAWVVIVPVANLHSQPDGNAGVISQAIYATTVKAVGHEQGGWLQVRTPDDYQGWVDRAHLRRLGSAQYPAADHSVRVVSLFANLYREPDVTRRAPLLTVPFETLLEVAKQPGPESRWIQLRLPDGRTAWIQRGDVTFDDVPLSIDQIIHLARRFVGLPYLWGGVSTFGFDCSGFTQMLCRRRGILIPRDAAPQARWDGMARIQPDELQPGDLVYFGESADKITHTGMYVGGGEFVHATTHLQPVVQVSRLDDPHWAKLLVACRRPKPEGSE